MDLAYNIDDTNRSLAVMDRAIAIGERYLKNIRVALGEGNSRFLSNRQYDTKVPRRVYMGLSNG